MFYLIWLWVSFLDLNWLCTLLFRICCYLSWVLMAWEKGISISIVKLCCAWIHFWGFRASIWKCFEVRWVISTCRLGWWRKHFVWNACLKEKWLLCAQTKADTKAPAAVTDPVSWSVCVYGGGEGGGIPWISGDAFIFLIVLWDF